MIKNILAIFKTIEVMEVKKTGESINIERYWGNKKHCGIPDWIILLWKIVCETEEMNEI